MKLFMMRRVLVAVVLAIALLATLPAITADAAGESGVKTCGGTESVASRVYGSGQLKANILGYYFSGVYSSFNIFHHSPSGFSGGSGAWNTSATNYYSYPSSYGYCA